MPRNHSLTRVSRHCPPQATNTLFATQKLAEVAPERASLVEDAGLHNNNRDSNFKRRRLARQWSARHSLPRPALSTVELAW